MILDSLNNAEKYCGLNCDFTEVFNKLREMAKFCPKNPDRQMIGDKAHIDCTPDLRLRKVAQFEYHKKHIDIHYVLSGCEYIDYCKRAKECDSTEEHETDFYLMDGEPDATLKLTPGMFAIFFIGEPHKPQMGNGNTGTVSKLIAKIEAL